jgi:hypothetical protein
MGWTGPRQGAGLGRGKGLDWAAARGWTGPRQGAGLGRGKGLDWAAVVAVAYPVSCERD